MSVAPLARNQLTTLYPPSAQDMMARRRGLARLLARGAVRSVGERTARRGQGDATGSMGVDDDGEDHKGVTREGAK